MSIAVDERVWSAAHVKVAVEPASWFAEYTIALPCVGCTSAGHCALLHVGAYLDHSPFDETPV